jgi:hypothetical protein
MVSNGMKARKTKTGMIKRGWVKPPQGKVKLNAILTLGRARRGVSYTDSKGQFLAACRVEIEGVLDVANTEAQAVRDGLRLAERIGCNQIDIEIESLQVVNAFQDPVEYGGVGMAFLDECRIILAGFVCFSKPDSLPR